MSTNKAPQDRVLLGTLNSDGTITGVTVDETTSVAVPPFSHTLVAFVIIGQGTTSSGVITLESAWIAENQGDPVGGWSTTTTVNASDVTGGGQKIVYVSETALFHTRARISTAIGGGGTIAVVLRYQ